MAYTLPTTGTDPKTTTKQALEALIDSAIAAVSSAAINGFIYATDTTDGLARTGDGEGFFTASDLQLVFWLNDSGAATQLSEIGTPLTQSQVEELQANYLTISSAASQVTEDAAQVASDAIAASGARSEAQAASDIAVLSATYATLPDLNTAALPDDTRATVWTTDDERDNYIVESGDGVWTGKNKYPTQTARTLRSVHPFPVDPAAYLDPLDADGWGGRGAPGLNGMMTSLYAYCSGSMPNAAGFTGTVTPRFGDGPNGGKTQRIQFGSTSATFYFFTGRFLEAGDWVASIRVKSTTGAGNQNIRFGELSDATDVAITEAGFTEIQRTIASTGANKALVLKGDTTNTPDVEIDEVRIHRADGSVDLPVNFGAGSAMRDFGLVGSWPMDEGVFKGITSGGILKSPDYPAPSSFDAFTFMIALRRDGAPGSTEVVFQTMADATLGTTVNNLKLHFNAAGEIATSPVSSVTGTGPNYCNGGWQIFAIRAKAGAAEIWHNGVETRKGTPADPSFDWVIMRLFGNTETSLPFTGDCGGLAAWDSYLTDAQLLASFNTMQSRLEQSGHQVGRGDVVYIAEGDSRTAAFSGAQGPSYGFLMFNPTYTGGVQYFGGNFSQSGDGIDDVEEDVPQVVRSIENAVALGKTPVASLLIGVNDTSTVIADPAAYWARIEAVLLAYKVAGARVIACTELPIGAAAGGGTGSAWETARASLRSLILASDTPDAVADFGNPATTMGDPDGPDTDATNWDDDLHPKSAGHTLLAPVMFAAIQAAQA